MSYTIRTMRHLYDTNGSRCDVKNIVIDQCHHKHRLDSRDAWQPPLNMVVVSMVTMVMYRSVMSYYCVGHLLCIDCVANRVVRMCWSADEDW